MYHRVAEPDVDPWGQAVSPDHLWQHLAVLRRVADLIDLSTLLADRRRPRPTVAVTFDDGYVDTLRIAADVLEAYDVPTTTFVSTAGVDTVAYCWWDQLAEVFLRPGTLPRVLHLPIDGASHTWDIGDDAVYPPTVAAAHRDWRANEHPPTARHAAYLDIWRYLIEQPDEAQRRIVQSLQRWADREALPTGQLLNGDEITQLGARRGISIGGHTVNHLALTAVDERTRRWEITHNRSQLQSLTCQPVDHFAYPYGRYAPEVVATVRTAGFTSGATTDPCGLPVDGDPFVLPRIQVPDLDGAAFERWLSRVWRMRR
ncbi:hypothetical protein BH23ACT10_BH23ACT10_35510 [soil metagenome]